MARFGVKGRGFESDPREKLSAEQGGGAGGPAGGDLSGTYPNPSVVSVHGVPADAVTTKGDVLVTSSTPALKRLGVGSDGYVLTARSSATNGVDWETPAGGTWYLPGANGTDDTTTINTALASGATVVKGQPGQSYTISAPLIVYSGQTFDMTGTTLTLKSGSNCEMVKNHGFANPALTGTGSVSSGSNVVTTSLASSATVGQTVIVAGAGGNGHGPLVGNISAIGSGTVTLVTLDGRACNATATVSGATCTIYNRDSEITLLMGTVVRPDSNAGSGPTAWHSLVLRHVDSPRVVVRKYVSGSGPGTPGSTWDANGGRYGVALGGVTNWSVRVEDSYCSSSPFQLNGPAWRGRVEVVGGQSWDDSCALTCGDYPVNQDTAGDIIGVDIGTVDGLSTNANLCKFLAGAGWLLDEIKVLGQVTGQFGISAVYIGDDNAQASTIGGTYGAIDFGTASGIPTGVSGDSAYLLLLQSPVAKHIKGTVHYHSSYAIYSPIWCGGTSTATIQLLDLDLDVDGNVVDDVVHLVNGALTINRMKLGGRYVGYTGNTASLVGSIYTSSIVVNNLDIDMLATLLGSGCGVFMNQGTITNVTFDGEWVGGATSAVWFASGASATSYVKFAGSYSGMAHLSSTAGAGATHSLHFDRPRISSLASGANQAPVFLSAGTVLLNGSYSGDATAASSVSATGGTIRSLSPQIPIDVGGISNANVGDLCNNTNASRSCGLGPLVCSGSGVSGAWKNLFTGNTF